MTTVLYHSTSDRRRLKEPLADTSILFIPQSRSILTAENRTFWELHHYFRNRSRSVNGRSVSFPFSEQSTATINTNDANFGSSVRMHATFATPKLPPLCFTGDVPHIACPRGRFLGAKNSTAVLTMQSLQINGNSLADKKRQRKREKKRTKGRNGRVRPTCSRVQKKILLNLPSFFFYGHRYQIFSYIKLHTENRQFTPASINETKQNGS